MKRGRIISFLMFVLCVIASMSLAWSATGLNRFASPVPGNLAVGPCRVSPRQLIDGFPSPVPKSGQTSCWNMNNNPAPVNCAGTGQDGEYQTGVSVSPRFTDNFDGTVKDDLTGLIWLRNANCFGDQRWPDALTLANTLASGECGLMDGSAAGEWRLPNVKEFQSLIDFGQFTPALPAGHPFSLAQSDYYWSSTAYAGGPIYAWVVDFSDGYVSIDFKNSTYFLWPVRGGR